METRMTQRIPVDKLKPRTELTSTFLVTAKYLRNFKDKPGQYLTLVLADKTGQIVAKVWENAAEADGICRPGDIVAVRGNVTEYNGALEIHLASLSVLANGEYEPQEFLPCCPQDTGDMWARLKQLIAEVTNPFLRQLLDNLFGDSTLFQAFTTAPAAKMNHQAYLGGLLEHTLNVTMLAGEVARLYPQVDKDLLLAGAILHDFGKIHTYEYSRSIDISDQGRLLGHIVLGILDLERQISLIPSFPSELRLKLLHIVASHHGRYEWQSPERPEFLEAAIIHHLDLMEANIAMFSEAHSRARKQGLTWIYSKTLDHHVWHFPAAETATPAATTKDQD